MAQAAAPRRERRRHPRRQPPTVRVWCVSGEFDELYTTVNFARRVLNLGSSGVCLETGGRLRADVKMSVEIRFEEFGGSLRGQGEIVWVDTLTEKGVEIHRAGLRFTEPVEATKPVRVWLEGGRPDLIVAQQRQDYAVLKQAAEARKKDPGAKRVSTIRIVTATLLVTALLYVASFWAFVLAGRTAAPDGVLRYRYLSGSAAHPVAERALAALYGPACWCFRKAGVALAYEAP